MHRLQRTILIISLIGIAITLGLLIHRLWPETSPQMRGDETRNQTQRPMITTAFKLVDQSGKPVTEEDFRGRYLLIYFGFAYCPDICPFSLDMMTAALSKLPAPMADRIQPIFISLDPERDTPAELARYIQAFDPRFVALTGSVEAVQAAAQQFKVYFRKVSDPQSAGGYVIDHSSIIYLMDPQGAFVHHFTHQDTEQTIAAKLQALIAK